MHLFFDQVPELKLSARPETPPALRARDPPVVSLDQRDTRLHGSTGQRIGCMQR